MMLSLLFGSLSLLFFNSWFVSLITMILVFMLCMFNMNQFFSGMTVYFFSFSIYNNLLMILSVMLCVLAIISTPDNKKVKYMLSIYCLMIILLLAFSVNSNIMFYIMFEASLIPTLLLIVSWGYQPERVQAGSYMMLYTVCASLPLLMVLLYYNKHNSSSMMLFSSMKIESFILLMLVLLAFLVKLPMYTVHLWLPKAHVEASLAGSMILAGILLKLGGYGLYQMSYLYNVSGCKSFGVLFLMSLSLWGGFLSSVMCLRQNDMKAFVAYSSVSHMSLVILGILNDQFWGILSSILTMYAHGLSSSALFCLTYFTYVKVHSRSMLYMKGILQMYPMISLSWFVYCCINMAVPPSLNLLGEMFIVPTMYSLSMLFILMMGLLVFMSGLYNMYLYSCINHGFFSCLIKPGFPMQSYQMMSLLIHFLPMLFLLKLEFFV
uniref:NADH dehydrogenase subunit 4 n=1 Tax=Polypylis sp. TS-2018 TaxID=2483258 RepID=UPI002A802085|nr:NADH dehydrogenase subunit 4 [Polypylis sp. TS-2018]WOZ13961.1 NADH dehydrogenase subunit 4 [Polypylis sp. TS-2018]